MFTVTYKEVVWDIKLLNLLLSQPVCEMGIRALVRSLVANRKGNGHVCAFAGTWFPTGAT